MYPRTALAIIIVLVTDLAFFDMALLCWCRDNIYFRGPRRLLVPPLEAREEDHVSLAAPPPAGQLIIPGRRHGKSFFAD